MDWKAPSTPSPAPATPTAAAAPVQTAVPSLSPAAQKLSDEIVRVGNTIRDKKSSGAAKDAIMGDVAQLKQLKVRIYLCMYGVCLYVCMYLCMCMCMCVAMINMFVRATWGICGSNCAFRGS